MDNAELRAQLIDYIDVLDKVKELFMIPGLEMMTLRQVAEFYEVDNDTLKKCYKRKIDDIDLDGTIS